MIRPDGRPPLLHDADDDVTARLLTDALHREAERIIPTTTGLDRIMAAIGSEPGTGSAPRTPVGPPVRVVTPLPAPTRRLQRWLPVVAASAVVLTAGGLGAVRLGLTTPAGFASVVSGQQRPAATTSTRSAPAPLAVYLVERQHGRWALVREFVPTSSTDPDERIAAAVREAITGSGTDADHTSVWATLGGNTTGLDQVAIDHHGSGIRVHLPAQLLGPGSVAAAGAPGGALAVQQLVWTVTAVAGTSGPVTLVGPVPGGRLFGTEPLDRGYRRDGGTADPRAPVWVSSISDGQQLRRGAATVRGDAVHLAGPGAGVTWALRTADGSTSAGGTIELRRDDGQPARPGERGSWQLGLSLPAAGSYLLEVSQSWPDDVSGPRWTDTKTLRVSP